MADLFSNVASAVKAPFDYLFSANQSSLNYSRARRMQEREYEMQQEMWNMSNEYNKPSAVVDRLRDAGINPNSAVSDGSVTTAAVPQSGAAGSYSHISAVNPASSFLESMLAYANVDKTKAEAEGRRIENSFSAERIQAEIKNLTGSARLSEQQASHIQYILWRFHDRNDAEIKLIEAQAEEVSARIKQLKWETDSAKSKAVIDKTASDLAKRYGVIIDHGEFGALVSALLNPALGDHLRTAISNILQGVVKGTAGGLKDAVKGLFGN